MITLDITIEDYIKFIEGRHLLSGYNSLDCPGLAVLGKVPQGTVNLRDMTNLINDRKVEWDFSFHLWALANHGDQMDEEMRTVMVGRLFATPKLAFMAYMNITVLTDKEDEELVAVFRDFRELAYDKVLSGELRRAKDG